MTHCAGLPKPSTAVRRTSSESFRSPVRASVCRRGLGSSGAAAGE
ncbi:putative Cytochrome c oxidase subunit I [Burkholderia pseudomallei 406e]|nr:putative Cytochrome c oxidase subunit I [Burkholderia pseudomallei 406e]